MNEIKKIYVKIKGGFGNQLFQFAKALEIQDEYGGSIHSLIELNNPLNTKRPYLLNFDNDKIKKSNSEFFKYYIFLKTFNKIQIFKEKEIYKYEKVIPSNEFILLDGYWQTFKSVESIKNKLHHIIFDQLDLNKNMQFYLSSINKNNSVSIHIRRGDYVTNKFANRFHGVLSMDYYQNAIDLLKSKFSDLKFIFFSDDIPWAKKYFSNLNSIFIENNNMQQKELSEIYLMMNCKHFIIANSSFSWWGAFMSKNEKNNIIIAPKKWLNQNISTIDLIPKHWIKI